jgi:hypothetical protein
MLEKDLEIYDIWEAPSGNIFIKLSDNYSIAIGRKGDHEPSNVWNETEKSQYVKSSEFVKVKKIGKLKFDK